MNAMGMFVALQVVYDCGVVRFIPWGKALDMLIVINGSSY